MLGGAFPGEGGRPAPAMRHHRVKGVLKKALTAKKRILFSTFVLMCLSLWFLFVGSLSGFFCLCCVFLCFFFSVLVFFGVLLCFGCFLMLLVVVFWPLRPFRSISARLECQDESFRPQGPFDVFDSLSVWPFQ